MYSGITGAAFVEDDEVNFGKWDLAMKCALPDRRGFMSRGFPRRADGCKDWSMSFSGPWDSSTVPFVLGQEYTLSGMVDETQGVQVVGRISGITPSNDLDGSPQMTMTAEASDDFQPFCTQLTPDSGP